MKMTKSFLVATALLGAVSVSPASAATITFDDLGSNTAAIANGYKGLNWDNFASLNSSGFPNSGYQHGTVSGSNVAFNAFGDPASISSPTAFTLNSGYFTGAWNNGLIISVLGLVNGIQTYSDTFTVDTTGPSLHAFNWTNLSTVTFISSGGVNAGLGNTGEHFALDNLSINSAVPEPATWAMMLVGFGMMGASMRYRRRSTKAVYA